MTTQTIGQQVRWQDLKVRSEIDTVLEIAKKEGWGDCEVFGHGDMITQPQESKGWKLLPADQYKYSIPTEGVKRLHQIINAGVRVQGVIIADDQRRDETPATPVRSRLLRRSVKAVLSFVGRVLLGLILLAGAIALLASLVIGLIYLSPLILLGFLVGGVGAVGKTGMEWRYDPKLIILVDDGRGGTAWFSLFTWYD